MGFAKCIIYSIVVLSAVACSFAPTLDAPLASDARPKPTVPLKKRPIVPTTKLPRPRVVEVWQMDEGGVMVKLSAEVTAAVTVTALESYELHQYVIDGGELVLMDMPAGAVEIIVEVDGEREVYMIKSNEI